MLSAPLTGAKVHTQNAGMTFSQAVKALEEAGFNQEQARAVAEAVSESVTTKADLLELELRLTEKFDAKIDALDKKIDTIDAKFDALDGKFDAKFDALDGKFDAKFDALDGKFDAKFDALNNRLLIGTLSIVAALVAATAGGVFTLVQLLK